MKVPMRELADQNVNGPPESFEHIPSPFEAELQKFLDRRSQYSGRHIPSDFMQFLLHDRGAMIEAPYGGENATPAEILEANPPSDAIMRQLGPEQIQFMPGGTMGDTPTQGQSMVDDDFIKMLQREVNQSQLNNLDWTPQENYPEETGRGMRHPNPYPISPDFTSPQTLNSGVAQEMAPNNRTQQILRKLRPSNETTVPKSPSVEDLLRSLGGG